MRINICNRSQCAHILRIWRIHKGINKKPLMSQKKKHRQRTETANSQKKKQLKNEHTKRSAVSMRTEKAKWKWKLNQKAVLSLSNQQEKSFLIELGFGEGREKGPRGTTITLSKGPSWAAGNGGNRDEKWHNMRTQWPNRPTLGILSLDNNQEWTCKTFFTKRLNLELSGQQIQLQDYRDRMVPSLFEWTYPHISTTQSRHPNVTSGYHCTMIAFT